MTTSCCICGNEANLSPYGSQSIKVDCRICSKYLVTDECLAAVSKRRDLSASGMGNLENSHLISGCLRHRESLSGTALWIYESDRSAEILLQSFNVPKNPIGQAHALIRYLADELSEFGMGSQLDVDFDYPVAFCSSAHTFRSLLKNLSDRGIIEYDGFDAKKMRLTLEGWNSADEMNRSPVKSKSAFVAMWFDVSMDSAYRDGFDVGLRGAGYTPFRIDQYESTKGVIDDILAKIRESRLVVADFTGHRGGVYFEAGFAQGMGIPVVWTVREDGLADLHFDIKGYNHIVWKDPEDLAVRLRNRVQALFPV